LIHVGDILTKGPHEGSLAVLKYMATHNVSGVRGNHDQQVIEWRGWINWVSSTPQGKAWLKRLERRRRKARKKQDFSLRSWVKTERSACSYEDKKWWRRIPKGWVLFSDHYKIAKDMSETQFQYLLSLPLRLYIPSAHAYIVHAGLLPSDPRYSFEDIKRQPLAHVPSLTQQPTVDEIGENSHSVSSSTKTNKTIERLRNLQEISLLTQIPQNTDPWVTLNMRSIVGVKISRRPKEGVPWTNIWNQHMNSCSGFKHTLAEVRDANGDVYFNTTEENMVKLRLSCYPFTTIYGHAASRGLVVKRWSFGLDSGCVYRRKLSALVIGKSIVKANWNQGEGSNDKVTDDVDALKKQNYDSLPFGDRGVASIIRVKCP